MSENTTGGASYNQGREAVPMDGELEQLQNQQRQIMDLIGCKDPAKLVHDVRNILNELMLLRALAEKAEKAEEERERASRQQQA